MGSIIAQYLFERQVWKKEEMALQEKENLYTFLLDKYVPKTRQQDPSNDSSDSSITSRILTDSDLNSYIEMKRKFEKEIGLSPSTPEALTYAFKTTLTYGTFLGEEKQLVSTASLNSWSDSHGTIGFVYTLPELRRKGLARCTFDLLFQDAKDRLRLKCLDLFTNTADHFYIALGFELVGEVCLFMRK